MKRWKRLLTQSIWKSCTWWDWQAYLLAMVNIVCISQDAIPNGIRCWILHPQGGVKPVGEGIVQVSDPCSLDRSTGATLDTERMRQEGLQHVIVTQVHYKGVPIMFSHKEPWSEIFGGSYDKAQHARPSSEVDFSILASDGGQGCWWPIGQVWHKTYATSQLMFPLDSFMNLYVGHGFVSMVPTTLF